MMLPHLQQLLSELESAPFGLSTLDFRVAEAMGLSTHISPTTDLNDAARLVGASLIIGIQNLGPNGVRKWHASAYLHKPPAPIICSFGHTEALARCAVLIRRCIVFKYPEEMQAMVKAGQVMYPIDGGQSDTSPCVPPETRTTDHSPINNI